MKTLRKNRKGTVIIAFAYFVVLILLPLLAIGYDYAMMQVFKTHLDNIAQVSALSCQPHYGQTGNEFYGGKCQEAMVKVAALNLNIKFIKNAKGTGWQADSETLNNSVLTKVVNAYDDMQTEVFKLSNEKFFKLKGASASELEGLARNPNDEPPMNQAVRNAFSFGEGANRNRHEVTSFTIRGVYHPLFLSFLGPRFAGGKFKNGITIESSPITVRAVKQR